MNVDALTGQVEAALEHVQAECDREIEKAQKAAAAANAERNAAHHALVQLTAQHAKVQDQLDAVTKHLNRASSLVALDSEIKKADKELQALKAEITKASTTLEGLVKQQRATEGQVATLRMEASSLAAAKAETEARMRSIRERFFG